MRVKSGTTDRDASARGYLLGGKRPKLSDMNKGELLATCTRARLRAHRGLSREELVQVLEGALRPMGSPLDEVRAIMAQFIQLYWDRVKYQMPEGCRGNCLDCADLKVLDCFNDNRAHLFKKG